MKLHPVGHVVQDTRYLFQQLDCTYSTLYKMLFPEHRPHWITPYYISSSLSTVVCGSGKGREKHVTPLHGKENCIGVNLAVIHKFAYLFGIISLMESVCTWSRNGALGAPLARASQEEQNGVNFTFIAPSSEELWVLKEI